MSKQLLSSIAKKQIAAITGLLLCGFVLTHLLGNFIFFSGSENFNSYGEHIASLGKAILF